MNGYLPESGYGRIFTVAGYAILGAGVIFLFFRFLFVPLLPFLLAWLTVFLLRPVILFLQKKTKMTERISGPVAVSLLLLLLGGGIVWVILRLFREAEHLGASAEEIISLLLSALDSLLSRLPIPEKPENGALILSVRDAVAEGIEKCITNLSSALPSRALSFLSSLPSALFFFAAYVLSSFSFAAEYSVIKKKALALLPSFLLSALRLLRSETVRTAFSYLRAYFLMMLLTFTELSVGFFFLHLDYSLLLAAVISLIDLMPVLGVGTVLIPWAVVCFLQTDYSLGIGLLTLYAVCAVVRQFLEPKIVGTSVGSHPLLTLCSMYLGYCLFGFGGMLFCPFGVTIAGRLMKREK